MVARPYDTTSQTLTGFDNATSQGGYSAFSFTNTTMDSLAQVQLALEDASAGTDGGSVTVTLYSGSGSAPVTQLAMLGTISDATLSTSGSLITLNVPAGITLAADTRYWIEVTGSSGSGAEYGYEAGDTGTGASGEYYYENGISKSNAYGATIASVETGAPIVATGAPIYDTTSQTLAGFDNAISQGGYSAFSFTNTTAGSLAQVRLELEDASASTDGGSVTVTLYSGSGSAPVTQLATLGTISDATLSTSGSLITLNVPAGITLAADTRYWIEVTGSSGSGAEYGYEAGDAGTGASGEYYYENGLSSPNAYGATVASVETESVACYCAGTLILTDRGEMPVEALSIGDRVLTMAGAAEPVRWIGRRSYAGRFLTGRGHLLPILFRTGSLGEGLPRRDLWVSPLHAMFLDGLLVPARCLVNGTTIAQELECERVDYFHVELAAHDVIFADGAPSETFVDDDSRGMFHNAAEWRGPSGKPAAYYAPRVEGGFKLQAIRDRLFALSQQAA